MVLMPTYYAFGFDGGITESGNRLSAIGVRVAKEFPQYSISRYRSTDAEDVRGSGRGNEGIEIGQNPRPDNSLGSRPVAGGGRPGFGTGIRPEKPDVDVVGIRPDYIDGRGRPGIELLPDRPSNRPGDVGVRPESNDDGIRPDSGFDIQPDRPDIRPGNIGVRPNPGTPSGYRPGSGIEIVPLRPEEYVPSIGVPPDRPEDDTPTIGSRGVVTFLPTRPEEPGSIDSSIPDKPDEPKPGTIQSSYGYVFDSKSRVNIKYQLSGWLRSRNG